jgi:hypothetical protein
VAGTADAGAPGLGRPALPARPLLAFAAVAAALTLVSTVAGAGGPVVTVTQTLPGLNDAVSGGFEPPDVQVAAGPGFVVELVNLAERVWQTGSGTAQLVQTRDLAVLFGSGHDQLTDPRVLFDVPSGRFFASVSDVETGSILLAVSAGSDPTGTWTVSSLAAPGCPDQPRLGIADDVVVLAADIYTDCERLGAPTLGGEIWTLNKAQLVAGSTSPAVDTFGPMSIYASLAPVQSLSSTSTEYVVAVDDRVSHVVHLLTVDGVPPAAVTVSEVAAPEIRTLTRPPSAPQPGIGSQIPAISTNDIRVLDSVWENGRLWFSANNRCMPPGDALVRTCARIVELATATRTVSWDVDLAVAGAHVFYPALRPDGDGNLVIVAAESGVKVLPQLVVFGRTADGAVTPPAVVAKSAGPYQGDRYGDYFAAARDPLHPGVVWVAGEAGTDVPSGPGWTTAVASVVVTAAGSVPPAVAGVAPPGVRAVRTVTRVGRSVRLAYRALDDGQAVRTVVTVRDAKSAVVYHVTTPRETLHAEQRYTVLWPAGKANGTFRFCVTTRSVSGVESPESCATITGPRAAP